MKPLLTPAELKARRERLGLTTKWLARRWGVALLTVQRWEDNRAIPDECAADLDQLDAEFQAAVHRVVHVSTEHSTITVPRVDSDSPDQMPASWHRAVAVAAADQVPGTKLVYKERQQTTAAYRPPSHSGRSQ